MPTTASAASVWPSVDVERHEPAAGFGADHDLGRLDVAVGVGLRLAGAAGRRRRDDERQRPAPSMCCRASPHLQSERRQEPRAGLRELDAMPRAREPRLEQLRAPIEYSDAVTHAFAEASLASSAIDLLAQRRRCVVERQRALQTIDASARSASVARARALRERRFVGGDDLLLQRERLALAAGRRPTSRPSTAAARRRAVGLELVADEVEAGTAVADPRERRERAADPGRRRRPARARAARACARTARTRAGARGVRGAGRRATAAVRSGSCQRVVVAERRGRSASTSRASAARRFARSASSSCRRCSSVASTAAASAGSAAPSRTRTFVSRSRASRSAMVAASAPRALLQQRGGEERVVHFLAQREQRGAHARLRLGQPGLLDREARLDRRIVRGADRPARDASTVPFGGRNSGWPPGTNGGGVGTSDWYCISPSTRDRGLHLGVDVREPQFGLRLVQLQLAKARIRLDGRLLQRAQLERAVRARAPVARRTAREPRRAP